jgi:hypothetical protein
LAKSRVAKEPLSDSEHRDLTRNAVRCDDVHIEHTQKEGEMNALRQTAFATAPLKDRPRLPVKPAPDRKPLTPEERHADMMRRFPRTMAYLAEH